MSNTRREELAERLRREFAAIFESLTFGELTLEFWRVADPDSLLDDQTLLESHQQADWQPYWAEAWEAATGIAAELTRRSLAGLQVLDLGCGLGLTGSVAAARGATVVLADFAPPALLFAELNSWPWRERVQVLRLDWRKDHLPQRFDLIIGSDILYDHDDLPFLDAFWREHLRPQGRVLLGDPSRAHTTAFIDWLSARGWPMSLRILPAVAASSRPIRLIELGVPARPEVA